MCGFVEVRWAAAVLSDRRFTFDVGYRKGISPIWDDGCRPEA